MSALDTRPRPPDRLGSRGATKETAIDVALDLDGTGRHRGLHRAPVLRPHARPAGPPRRVRPRPWPPPATSRSTPTTPSRTWASPSARRWPRRSGDKAGIRRFASIALPLDEALVEVALDLSGRPFLAYDIEFAPDTAALGTPPFDPQLAEEFWRAFATAAAHHPARPAA